MAAPDLYRRLRDLLEREHEALLGGQLDQIARLADEKERLQAQLAVGADRAHLSDLGGLQRMAGRNADLLNAVRRGLETARARLMQIRDGGPQLNTYDRLGQRSSLGAPRKTLERRA
ncbi:hypothetical protein [Actibacterium sp. D379-3]